MKMLRGRPVDPFSPWLYMRRNLNRTAPVTFVIVLSVVLICTVITIIRSIDLTVLTVYGYQRHFCVLAPRTGVVLPPLDQAQILSEPLVRQTAVTAVCLTTIHTIFGKFPFVLFGFTPEDMKPMLSLTQMRLIRGRLPREGQPECAISVEVARNRGLKLGDPVLTPDQTDSFSPVEVKLVGLLSGPSWFAVTDRSFVTRHFFPALQSLIVSAGDARKQPELDRRLKRQIDPTHVRMFSFGQLVDELRSSLTNLYLIMRVVVTIVVVVLAIMMGMLSNIFFAQRLPEFGLLVAMGYTRSRLLWRIVRETAWMVFLGWVLGAALSAAILKSLQVWLFDPRGLLLNPLDPGAYLYTIPIPFAVLLFAALAVGPRLLSLDPVQIIERKL